MGIYILLLFIMTGCGIAFGYIIKDNSMETCIDKTTGVRLLMYLQENFLDAHSHPIYEEEYDYLCIMGYKMLKESFENPENNIYFNNMAKDCCNAKEFINVWYKPKFSKYLINVIKKYEQYKI